MIETSMNQTRADQQEAEGVPIFHDAYDVRTENGGSVGINLLCVYYGALWVSAMDRLNHKIDGHLFNIQHEGVCYGVYRKLVSKNAPERTYLRLVKPE